MTIKQKINTCKNNKGTYTLIDYLFTKAKTDRGLTIALYKHFDKNGYDYDKDMNIEEKISFYKQGIKEGFYEECNNGIVIFADADGEASIEWRN